MADQNSTVTMAVIELGGKQHLVAGGAKIIVNRLDAKEGETVKTVDLLTNNPVELKVVAHSLGDKVRGLKFKNKVRYLKRYGHRQQQTIMEVLSFGAKTSAAKAEAPKAKESATDKKPAAKKVATKASAKKKPA